MYKPYLMGRPGWVKPGASFDADFAMGRVFGAAGMAGAISTTRASTGYAQTSSGLLVPFASNVPRITDQGLLVEEARTNLVLQSQNQADAAWTLTTISAGAAVASPDGTNNAFPLTENGASANIRSASAITVVSGSVYTVSFILKRGNFDWMRLLVGNNTSFSNAVRLWVNMATGANGTFETAGTGWTAGSAFTVVPLSGGYYRFSYSFTPNTTSIYVGMASANANGATTRADVGGGAGVGTTYTLFNPQIELGAFPTSIIPTTTVAVTRAADVITLTGAAATAALASKAAYYETNGLNHNGAPFLLSFGTGSDNQHYFQTTTTVRIRVGSATSASATIGNSGTTAGLVKSAFGYDATSGTAKANGGTPVTNAAAWNPSGTIYLGNLNGVNSLNGYMRRAVFGPTKGQFDGMTA